MLSHSDTYVVIFECVMVRRVEQMVVMLFDSDVQ